MTRRERIANRIEKRRQWAEARERDSTARYKAARRISDNIPFGQPVLVGHHSEKHHRRDLARIDSNMRRSVESAEMARTHESKAASLERTLETSIFSDDDNAIEALEAKIAGLEARRERIKQLNKLIRAEMKAGTPTHEIPAKVGATDEERAEILGNISYGWRHEPTYPPYVAQNIGGRIQQAKKRIEAVKARESAQAKAEAAGGVSIVTHAESNWCVVTFVEKPERAVLDALKAAHYGWGNGSWQGYADKLPEAVRALTLIEAQPGTP